MARRDILHNVGPAKSILAANLTGNGTTTTGTSVDLLGYSGALVSVSVGAPGDTLSGALFADLQLQESSDDSSYTGVAAGDMQGVYSNVSATAGSFAKLDGSAGFNGSATYAVGYIGSKRYLKVLAVRTGNHATGTPMAASVIRAFPKDGPADVPV